VVKGYPQAPPAALNVAKRGAKDVEMDAFGYVMARHGLKYVLNVARRGAKDVEMDAFGYVMARHGLKYVLTPPRSPLPP